MSGIELHHVTYRYGKGGVSDLSFTVPEGSIACLLGPSGSGKTTVLRLIAGFLTPQQGQVRIGGTPVAGEGAAALPPQQRKVGLVFQQHALFPHLTVADNVLFGCTRPKAERTAFMRRLLEDFHIRQHETHYPHQLSGGEQQRVALARALASDPALLLMDEPFSSLDQHLREQVRNQCLAVIRARKLTCLMVTHDEQEAALLADHIIRLDAVAA